MLPDDRSVTGPIQLLTVGFLPGTASPASILDDVDELQGRGVLRLLDAVMLAKQVDGSLEKLEVDENDFGELIESVTDLDLAGLFGLVHDGDAALEAARALAPGAAIAVLLVEHRWAGPLFDTIAAQGGVYLGDGFVTEATQTLFDRRILAFDQAANAVAEATDVEVKAAAEAAGARAAADEAIAQADAITSAAAQRAVDSLIAAGVIEAAAADEAFDAVTAAALVIDAAEQDVAHASTAASVTAKELRVLRLLPTPATFAVIAAKLGISRSAAKQRAERTYKKFSVHNRADAVSRARELKLIPKSAGRRT